MFQQPYRFLSSLRSSGKKGVSTTVRFCAVLFLAITAFFSTARAATWYVDANAMGTANGSSWANAWNSVQAITGVNAGDTVYVSGGASGSTETYSFSGSWMPAGGTAAKPITYQIGQDSLHNGTAIFNCTVSGQIWLYNISNAVVSGDAGDGTQHFKLTGFSRVTYAALQSNLRIAYIYADSLDAVGDWNPVTSYELDHCYFYITDLTADHAIYAQVSGTTWDDTRVHDNTIYVPNSGNGTGADALQLNGNGFSAYNNDIFGYTGNYTGGQHQDGWQGTGNSSYVKIYANYFQNIANYPVFGDAYYGGFNHVRVYDNIMVLSTSEMQATDAPQGIAIGPDGGAYNNLGYWPAFSDIIISNNLVADYGTHQAIALNNNSGQSSTFTSCTVENNVVVNSGQLFLTASATQQDNVSLTTAEAAQDFVTYVTLGGSSNNYHLTLVGSAALSTAANVSSLFTTDFAGNTWTTWLVGPYSYSLASSVTSAVTTTTSSSTTTTSSSNPKAPSITSSLTVTAKVGSLLNYGIYASNNPTSFAASGVPPGTTFESAGGIVGTLTTAGTYSVTLNATNSYGTGAATLVVTVTGGTTTTSSTSTTPVIAAPSSTSPLAPSITSSLTASATVGNFFNYGIYASNNPTSFTAANVAPGTMFESGGGIVGTLTTAGTYYIALTASNSFGTGSATLVLTVTGTSSSTANAATATAQASTTTASASSVSTSALVPSITSNLVLSANVGDTFNYGIYASNNATSFSATNVPPGTTFESAGGIVGTLTTPGTYNVELGATNSYGTGTATLVLTVVGPATASAAPSITSTLTYSATVGSFFNYGIYASNNPTSFSATNVPPGTSFASGGGIIGTLTTAGTYYITLGATNSAGTGTAVLVLTVSSS